MTTANTGIYYLVTPKRLVSKKIQTFARQVLIAAFFSKKNTVSLICEGDEGEEAKKVLEAVKGYPLPVLLCKDDNASVYFQSSAAVSKLLGEESNNVFDLSLNDLASDDKVCVFGDNALLLCKVETASFTNLNADQLRQSQKILVSSVIATLIGTADMVCDEAKSWYDSFITKEEEERVFSILSPFLPKTSTRQLKAGIEFEYDWKVERLPQKDTRNILITAALPYVNNVPHLGNIIGAVLSADVFARYARLCGYQAIYIGGTDEYGTATETKALEEGISCAELCAKYYKLHSAIYDWFGIQTDIFGRSSTPKQTAITHEIFNGLYKNGYFFEQAVEQTFCEGCDRFLADRYVEGTCPHCSYTDARGDQCDACGKLLNPMELKEPRCKLCRRSPIVKKSNHLFLDLAKLQPLTEEFVNQQSVVGKWSLNSTSISKAWLTEGLRPRCMTRDLKWGTPVPVAGFENKVFYVWFDACFGYISITANYTDGWRQWWQCNANDAKVELYQFMGKDNVPFHTVIFPSTLLGTVSSDESNNDNTKEIDNEKEDCSLAIQKCPWTLLHHINTTEYLNYENGKFSKSRGIGVFGNDARDSGIPVEVWRYYLLSVRPESTDSVFSWNDFGARNNNELLANLGNFVSRVSKFTCANYDQCVPGIGEMTEIESKLIERVNEELKQYLELMEAVSLKGALKQAMSISSLGNQYLTEAGLDRRLLTNSPARCSTIITIALHLSYLLATILDPFIPTTSDQIRRILNVPARMMPKTFEIDVMLKGHQIGEPFHLFTKIEDSKLVEFSIKFAGKQAK